MASQVDYGFHKTSVAIKREHKPALDALLERLSVKSVGALLTFILTDLDDGVATLEPLIARQRAPAALERAARIAAAAREPSSRPAPDSGSAE